ncbi:MAG: type IV pilus biogenesis protein PilM [Planctomycetota bacterium]|jgi:hypothetical protein
MAQATGIHISATRITAVFLKGTSKSPKVVSAGWMPIPPADEMDLGKAVRHLLGEHTIPRDPAVVTLANDEALMRSMAMPFTRYEEIKKVLKGEAEAALPGISVDQVVITSHFLGAHEAEGQVMTIAMRKERLAELLGQMQSGGVDPVGICLEGFSLAEAVIALDRAPEGASVVVADADADCLGLAIIADRRVRVVRTIQLPMVLPDGGFNVGILGELHDELTRTLVAGGLMEPPAMVLMTGSAAGQPAIRDALEKVIGVTPEPLAMEIDEPDSPLAMPGGSAAYGAALQGLGADATGVNLRVDEFGFKRTFDQVAGALAALVTIAFICGLILFVDYQQQHREAVQVWNKATLSPAFKRWGDSWRKVRPDQKEWQADRDRLEKNLPRTKLMGEMIRLLQEENKRLKQGPVKAEFDMRSQLDVWKAFADSLATFRPSSKYWVIDQFDVTPRDLTVKGWFGIDGGRADLGLMLNSLKAHEYFRQAEPGANQVKKGPDGQERLQFSVSCRLPEEEQKKAKGN